MAASRTSRTIARRDWTRTSSMPTSCLQARAESFTLQRLRYAWIHWAASAKLLGTRHVSSIMRLRPPMWTTTRPRCPSMSRRWTGMYVNFTRRLTSFEPLVRVCTKTECRRRRPLAKTSIRFGPSPNSTLRLPTIRTTQFSPNSITVFRMYLRSKPRSNSQMAVHAINGARYLRRISISSFWLLNSAAVVLYGSVISGTARWWSGCVAVASKTS